MKKKFIALFAACSMITTAVAGMVQMAYADDDPISIVVSDGASATEKVLTLYYGPEDGVNMIEGTLTVDNGATISSAAITISIPAGMGDSAARASDGYIMCLTYDDNPLTSADKSFATATVTVPGDADVTASFRFDMFDKDDNDFSDTVEVTIPKNAAPTEAPTEEPTEEPTEAPTEAPTEKPAITVEDVNLNASNVPGTYEHADQSANIYGVEIGVNQPIKGVRVVFDDTHKGELNFDTTISDGSVIFAVIFANETGTWTGALPALEADMISAITE